MLEPDRLAVALDRVAEGRMAARWRSFGPECDERRKRLWAASEAKAHGLGGVALAARVTGLSQETVRRGVAELESKTIVGAAANVAASSQCDPRANGDRVIARRNDRQLDVDALTGHSAQSGTVDWAGVIGPPEELTRE